ncbi:MAG: hypothetical protein NZM16_12555, partial [Thermoflexus sp.]
LTPVPLWWLAHSQRNGLNWFYMGYSPSHRAWLICRRPYTEEVGFDEEDLGAIDQGVIID